MPHHIIESVAELMPFELATMKAIPGDSLLCCSLLTLLAVIGCVTLPDIGIC